MFIEAVAFQCDVCYREAKNAYIKLRASDAGTAVFLTASGLCWPTGFAALEAYAGFHDSASRGNVLVANCNSS